MKKSKFAFVLGTFLIVSSCFPVKAEIPISSNDTEIVNDDNSIISDNEQDNTISDNESNNVENVNQEEEKTESVEINNSNVVESNPLEIVNNDDGSQTITYEEVISNVEEENVETIIEDKITEQEEIKESVESQEGTYNYNINVNEEQNVIEVIVPVEEKEVAESVAAEHEGEVITEEHITVQETSETFNSLEEAQNFVSNIEDNHTIIESTITITPEQIISGITVEQIEENGYHCIENEDGSFDIIVTGGLEEITIDLAYLSEVLEPGDSISAEFHIKNESGDEYTIESYNKEVEGPFRYIRTTRYDESMGEAVGTLMDGAYTYYIPNSIVNMHGQMHLATPADEVVKWYNEKNNTQLSYREIQNTITDDLLLEYYNEILNKEYDSLYEAWVDNFNERLWTTEYNGQDGNEFFKNLEWENDEFSFVMTANVDGPGTDNMYQNSVWGYIEQIILKVVDTIIPASYEASVVYEDVEYKYSVKYDEIEKNYTIEIKGEGNIPSVEVVIPDEPIPNPTPSTPKREERTYSSKSEQTITPTVIIEDNLVPLAEEPAVLGVSREVPVDSEPRVLGAHRDTELPQTGNSLIYFIFLFFVSGIILIFTGFRLSREN